ncbi:TniQ family protein [Allorhizobium taibaishanense]|uniref:TniQ domain-containing protein n=1 Tax=Allorhizobium taibaishanense TaxID=887144 RepID=A0A1Q9ABZ8_9HYPH|nr:TniQ family protein [Allorhizobium taibaishanense]MBB4010258.1 hypothetical protein [Allorhizobium taibaishanense]OLP52372.1 hypothetical protein BJF91_02255 [Allorhizobium taibaishanense]
MTLRVTLNYHADETRLSLVSRLALANGYRSMQDFLSLNAVNAAAFEAGNLKAVELLSKWSGVDVSSLSGNDLKSAGGGSNWRLGSVLMNKEMRTGPHHRYCPKCVVADLREGTGRPATRPYVRINWMTRAIQTCAHHGCKIMEKPAVTRSLGDFSRFVATNLTTIEHEATMAPVGSRRMDIYIGDRIASKPTNAFLDGFDGYVAHDLCRYFGGFAHAHEKNDQDAVADTAIDLVEKGFDIAAAGADRIETVIAKAASSERPLSREMGAFFGELRPWLRRNRKKGEFEKVVNLFQEIAERYLPIGKDDLFVLPTRQRRLHSIRSASIEFAMDEERVCKLLMKAGLLEQSKRSAGRLYFDAQKGHEVLADALDTMTSTEVAGVLGIHVNQMRAIFEADLLPRAGDSEDGVRVFSRVRRSDFEKFALKLQATSANEAEHLRLCKFATVVQTTFCTTLQFVELAIDGKLGSLRRLDDTGLISGLGVDVSEIKAILVRNRKHAAEEHDIPLFDPLDPDPKLLNAEQVKNRLSTTTSTVAELLRLNRLEVIDGFNPSIRRTQKYFVAQSVQDFIDKHISLTQYAQQSGRFGAALRMELSKLGIEPVYEPTARNARFYRKRDLEKLGLLAK